MIRVNPTTALELQQQQLEFSQSPNGLKFWDNFYHDARQMSQVTRSAEVSTLRTAPTYLVTKEMYDLALYAARTMPNTPLTASDLPSIAGFCLYQEPSVAPDISGKVVSDAGFSWHLTIVGDKPGVFWVNYSDITDPRDAFYDPNLPTWAPRLLPIGSFFEPFGEGVPFDDILINQETTQEALDESLLYSRKVPLCLFALMQQTIVQTDTEKPERATRRRLQKANSPLQGNQIKVVRLRRLVRRDPKDGECRPVDWTHRWVVNGHWRMQPTKEGVKRIWIMPFVKGDPDLPLLIKPTVHHLVR